MVIILVHSIPPSRASHLFTDHLWQTENYIYALLTKREVKMAGYWPSSFFAFLWTETKSRSIKTQKKNESWKTTNPKLS